MLLSGGDDPGQLLAQGRVVEGRILRQHIEALDMGYSKTFVIYDPKDQEKTMDMAIRSMNLDPKDYQAYQMLQMVGKFKNGGIEPDAIPPGSVEDPFHIRVYRQYQLALRQNNAMDFDDLLFLTLRLLRENESVRQQLQLRYEQILVDEYQDTNSVQFELIRLLGGHHRNVFVVGDVDQSIYSFRHANFRIILRFQEDYPDARLIKLEENYRSTGSILAAANDLIQHNTERYEKTLIATRGQGKPIRFHQAPNEDEESLFIVKQIQRLNEQDELPFGSFAILYRTNAMSRIYEQKLIQNAVPYHVVGGYRFYDRREIKDLLGYLNVIHNPFDSLSLKRIINTPKRGLGDKALETLETSASFEGRGLTLWEGLQTERVIDQLTSSKARDNVQWLVSWLKQLRRESLPISTLLERIYNESGYRADIDLEPDSKKREDRHENVLSFIQSAIEFEAEAESDAEKCDLTSFLEKIALYSDSDSLKAKNHAVSLMTVHGAKGLEFPVVFIPAVEEGTFPHIRSLTEANPEQAVEEERRLMYVALTRAKNRLFLTCAAQRRNKRATNNQRLSRFMMEIAHHLQIPGEILADVKRREYEDRQKKMNLKGVADLPRSLDSRFGAAPGPRAIPTSPIQTAAPPAAPQPELSPMAKALQAKAAQAFGSSGAAAVRSAVGPNPGQRPMAASPRPTGVPARNAFKAGDRVRHPELGIGQIDKVIASLAKVTFPSGVKTFDLASAPLEKLG
ncbi:MAG: ATP-dependent DNA helicase PcrA [Candidatus Melainabacteria bacterium HGW-Melainabacteria-1]|nr:MAG: ATP-dependent DNA helicase PcrA [Candidatus Melainabacteria bacterium HGW-Melainabacteria-1]